MGESVLLTPVDAQGVAQVKANGLSYLFLADSLTGNVDECGLSMWGVFTGQGNIRGLLLLGV